MAETVGYVNRARAFMPPGTVPPFITRFDAGSVAVGQLVFSSATHTQGEMQDFALNRVRPLFATLPGVSAPPPFGGNQRTIVVTLDPDKLQQYRISPEEAIAAVSKATRSSCPPATCAPASSNRIARTNAALGGNLVGTAEHAHPAGVRDHRLPARHRHHRKRHRHRHRLRPRQRQAHRLHPRHQARRRLHARRDQRASRPRSPISRRSCPTTWTCASSSTNRPTSRNSIRGLITEGLLGAVLTGLMVLLFLRDWRSALIVVLNIPFALLSAVILLWATGQTINIMTLGGLALAVGVLVDEATVEIENIHTQMLPGVSRARAVVEACSRTAMARLLSMFCILAVFVPSFFMVGVGTAAVRAALAGRRVLDDRVVPAVQHPGAGLLHVADARSAPRRRARRALRAPALDLRTLSRCGPALSLAAGAGLSGGCMRPALPASAAHGNRVLSRCQRAAASRSPARSGRHAHRGDRAHGAPCARRDPAGELGPDNVAITSDFVGVVPSSYPVDLIHLFTSGPQEAIIQVALKPDTPRGEALRERLRQSSASANCRTVRSPSKPATSSAR